MNPETWSELRGLLFVAIICATLVLMRYAQVWERRGSGQAQKPPPMSD